MTTTPEPIKGVPRHEGNSTFLPRADHNSLADWVKAEVAEAVANAAALPTTGNWAGRQRFTTDDDLLRVHDGSGFLIVGGRIPFAQTALAADQAFSGSGLTVVNGMTAEIANAPAGIYDLRVYATVSASAPGAGNVRVAINGAAANDDIGFDFSAAQRQSYSFGIFYNHAGGNLKVEMSVLRTSGTWTVEAVASRSLISFLRPV